ncbi:MULTISPECIES: type 1 glutamine amidotransferase [Corynebacterium]|uniref:Lipid II isoglutaminyl synthase (glutamine-hydrolyzing) subunit GatD n=2 Tax=Corynebacterium glucuronolyticum TaxID=39791 RepID=A0A7T4JVA1_9CORY|nr:MULTISPECIES: glutamine amidotransferase [Corynebacterium]EEI28040.1 CobB/CobQ-like protein [Corynebacterium glucuronolyticum ATCC 51867]EEI62461.1 CobB/CobQ-like protein [Corynebacterium glucuronolyticum ATCC 51866]MCT1442815.1 glutamine amidotransferase [Corynebacterium glucuronolyticum]MCT1563391.1 glutamine amidotransferase [Corynebacterium glucuronolyticum]OFO47672.1 glutamine amidotransferase [Corynebacterium sp. HMSC073D01]
MSELTIGLLLPDVLGTYGDNGNALVLRSRAEMRGLTATIKEVKLGDPVPLGLDVYLMGGGEDTAQTLAVEHLADLTRVSAPILAICAGLQVLGESFRANGRVIDGVGLIDATTTTLKKRAIGEIRTRPTGLPGLTETLTGFENHMGATLLGADAAPLGTVLVGVGNSDSSGTYDMADPSAQLSAEGVVQGNVIATYLHGPVLARNPQLADVLLERATGMELEPLNLPEVEQLRKERLAAKRMERF